MSAALSGGVTGAASGAATGAAFGGAWGAAIGGVLGGIGGMFSGKGVDAAAKEQRRAIRTAYREKWRQSSMQYKQLIGTQNVGYAGAGVAVGRGTPSTLANLVNYEFANYQLALRKQEKVALKGATPATDFWGMAAGIASSAGSIYGGYSAQSTGPSSFSKGSPNAQASINGGIGRGEQLA